MTTFSYSTELEIDGPWLLETDALERLDKILESALLTYQTKKEADIEEAVKARIEEAQHKGYPTVDEKFERESRAVIARRYSLDSRNVRVELGGTKSITKETVAQAVNELAATSELPYALNVSLERINVKVSISVGGFRHWQNDKLQLRVSPEASTEAHEIFGALRQWAQHTSLRSGNDYGHPLVRFSG